ncbi:histidine acid phosphatase [Microdochium bolleyi]|uniref:3-phytase n=1 Tax=Microdochium bolleyi TaxID=196109 RepID=A0A136IRK3_9PEZI|nr:histidine acid phosphatase [Microdochium bolleyi]
MTSSILSAAFFAAGAFAERSRMLAPASPINSPAGLNAQEPLKWVGANGPWLPSDNVFGIDPDTPEGCTVDQAAYITRHGSRYPDNGAYNGWVAAHERYQARGYTASGVLSFLHDWEPVLENKAQQIAMENPTGAKEAFDMGYQLRTRYPGFYRTGDEFLVWANNYTRVLQTADKFVHGYLGVFGKTNGSVISVTGKGFPGGTGDTLAPSDMCPAFVDTSGADQVAAWDAVWVPPVLERLQALITGNLTLTADDITQGPYLCGFESHITGRLSPWCDIFTDEEFRQYQYRNDLRYWYGVGPGAPLNKKMMTPYLDALMGLFKKGPAGLEGVREDGVTKFDVPPLIVSFLNDGQLNELVAASGVFDTQEPLDPEVMDDERLWIGSRFGTMRGTIAFERMTCKTAKPVVAKRSCGGNGTAPIGGGSHDGTYVRILLNDAVFPVPNCQSGPGRSCLLDDYTKFVAKRYAEEGDWLKNCNVTDPGAPTKVKGASFYTDLSSPWLKRVEV